jgi:hypothetical protein
MNLTKLWFQLPCTRLIVSIILKFPQGTIFLLLLRRIFVELWILSTETKCKEVAPMSTARLEEEEAPL